MLDFIDAFIKGENGEKEVFKKLKSFLDAKGANYYLLQHAALDDITASDDIDVLLVHPVLGIYVIEVKNWKSLDNLKYQNPYTQANRYQDLLMSNINSKIGNVINVEYRVVFPEIRKKDGIEYLQNAGFGGYLNNTIFKEDLENLEEFFKSTNNKIPTKEEFLKITSLLIPLNERKEDVLPIITKDEVLFFDYKQLSVLNGYTGGLRVIRGVAGTGKSLVLVNYVKNYLKKDKRKFLVLCYNSKLARYLQKELKSKYVKVFSVFGFLKEIGFTFEGKKAGKCPKCGSDLVVRKGRSEFIGCSAYPKCKFSNELSLNMKYKILENEEILKDLKNKIKKYNRKEKFDFFLADETQDFPAGLTRLLIDEINNSILFIDEAQKIFPYTMDTIKDVIWHKNLGTYKVNKNNFRNLYNVYRTPNNISKCAFEILSHDKEIDEYYKQINFLKNGFIEDVKFVLEEGEFLVDDFNEIDELKNLVDRIDGDKIILSFRRDDVAEITKKIQNIDVMPMQAVKGLEADNIIIHNFEEFLNVASKNKEFFRQVYVLLTRSRKNIYISINKDELYENENIKKVLNILNKYSNTTLDNIVKSSKNPVMINKEKVEEYKNYFVAGAEILAAVVGLFNL